jgi:hypothetical protein
MSYAALMVYVDADGIPEQRFELPQILLQSSMPRL